MEVAQVIFIGLALLVALVLLLTAWKSSRVRKACKPRAYRGRL